MVGVHLVFNLDFSELPASLRSKQGYDLNDLDLSRGVDHSCFFVPEEMSHLFYSPAYQLLGPNDRLVYNQVTGLALCEQFIFLEDHILAPMIRSLLRSKSVLISPPLRAHLERFLDEEAKHGEMFWRVLEAAAPEKYPRRKLRYAMSVSSLMMEKLLLAMPLTLVAWIWLAMFFEERTVHIARLYRRATNVCPVFQRAHHLHMTEETQHVELDKVLIDRIYRHCSPKLRAINAKILRQVMARYSHPRRIPSAAIAEAMAKNPALRIHRQELAQAIKDLRTNTESQQVFYSRTIMPRTFASMNQFPEMMIMQEVFPDCVQTKLQGSAA